MREIRKSGSMSGRWKRSTACGPEPRRGNPDTRTYRRLNHRAPFRLYSPHGRTLWTLPSRIEICTRPSAHSYSHNSRTASPLFISRVLSGSPSAYST